MTSIAGVGAALRTLLAPALIAARVVTHGHLPATRGLPAPHLSFALAAKMVLDEVFFLTEVISAGCASAWDRGRSLGPELAAALDLYEARGWLDNPASFHGTPPPVRSSSLCPSRSWGPGFLHLRFNHLKFESEYEPHPGEPGRDRWLGYDANRTAHAWLLQHDGGPRPWLVCVHAYRMGFPLADFLAFPAAWFHKQLGLNVAFPVLPLHGPRKVGWRTGDGIFSGDILDTIHMQTQAVWDVRRLVGWLRAQGAPAVAVYGLSLGGYTTALLAGLEANLDCVVAGVPHTCYAELARWNVPAFALWLADRLGIPWEGIERILRVISPLALPPRVPRHRRYLFAAIADRLVPPGHAHNLWLHWDRPRATWYEGSHVSFGWEAAVRALLHEALETTGFLTPSSEDRERIRLPA